VNLRDCARTIVRAADAGWRRAGARAGLLRVPSEPVQFVVEEADWAIRRVGTGVRDGIETFRPGTVGLTTNAGGARRQIVHFGSQYMWVGWGHLLGRSNRYVTSFFHGKPEDGPEVARHIDAFLASEKRLSKIVASNSLLRTRLEGWGVAPDKIAQIPIGVDTKLFAPPDEAARAAARQRFGVPEGAVCIGSFQKDGVGWGDGMEPKLIKGPDLFVEAVRILARDLPVYVLLTGPARGYVAAGLEAAGIPFSHDYVRDYADLRHAYYALDLYLVTSREEGGPMALMESMSSRVPVISTPVGMAPDLIEHGRTGWLTEIEADAIAAQARAALATPDREAVLDAAQVAVRAADWQVVAESHWTQVYEPLMATP
jgi:glycosyltransferase involved in cell wall biosynthesis